MGRRMGGQTRAFRASRRASKLLTGPGSRAEAAARLPARLIVDPAAHTRLQAVQSRSTCAAARVLLLSKRRGLLPGAGQRDEARSSCL